MTPETMRSSLQGSPNTELPPPKAERSVRLDDLRLRRRAGAGLRERVLQIAALAFEHRAHLDGERLVDDVAKHVRVAGQHDFARAHRTFDAAVHGHAFGDDVALDHAGVADGQRTAAHIAFDLAIDLQLGAVSVDRAGDLHAIGDDRGDAAAGRRGTALNGGFRKCWQVRIRGRELPLFVNMPSCPQKVDRVHRPAAEPHFVVKVGRSASPR